MSDHVSPFRVFSAILLRDVTVARRELPFFLMRTTLQPILFVIVFGYLLPRMGIVPRGYTTLMMPGIVALSLTLSAIQSVALPMMADFGFTKEIEDRLNKLVARLCEQGTVDCVELREVDAPPLDPRMANRLLG